MQALHIVHGSDSYLISKEGERLAQAWRQKHPHTGIERHDGQDLIGKTEQLFESDLFASAKLLMIRNAQALFSSKAAADLFFEQIRSTSNVLVLQIAGMKLPEALRARLKTTEHRLVVCASPKPQDIPAYLKATCKDAGLQVDESALRLIHDAIGDRPYDLDNQVRSLAQIFADFEGVLSAKDLSPYLSGLKVDGMMELRQQLLMHRPHIAQSFCLDLLRQGEAAIALNGFLASHFRKSVLSICGQKKGFSPRDLSERVGSSPYAVAQLCKAYQSRPLNRLLAGILACERANRMLKSSRRSEQLILTAVVDTQT